MKIAIGSDHVGYPLKQSTIEILHSLGMEVVDVGTHDPEKPVDYPDFALAVNRLVASGTCEQGVLICGTGLGMSIAANKFPGIRAALCDDAFMARLSRAHNDANVLCMGANITTPQRADWIVQEWLSTPFDDGRHASRVAKLDRAFQGHSSPGGPQLNLNWDRFAVAMSPKSTVFGPMLFAGCLEEGLQAAAQAGFRKVEFSLRVPEDFKDGKLDDLLSKNKLCLSAIATGQSCLHDQLCLASPYDELRGRALERLKDFIVMAQRFESAVIIGGIRGRLAGSTWEMQEQRNKAVDAMRECACFAEERSVPLLLEPINRYETNFINTSLEGLALLAEIGAPGFKLLLDTFHMNIEEPDIPMAVLAARERLGYIHFADSNREAPGCGHVDFNGVLQALVEVGYEGVISTEIMPLPDDLTALNRAASFYRTLVVPEPG